MKRVIFSIVALCSMGAAVAQGSASALEQMGMRSNASGMLMNRDVMSVADMVGLSQSPFQYGTARSMAMAGAMTSLGGDASSMMINPAGLGMYRSGEIAITPMVSVQRADTRGAEGYMLDGSAPFSMSNLSAVFNVHESGSRGLISINMGIGYNKIADLNYNYSFMSPNNSSSIASLFSRQLTGYGVPLSEVYGDDNPNWNTIGSNLWAAALGYKNGLTFQTYGDTPSDFNKKTTERPIPNDYPIWTPSWIAGDTQVGQFMEVISDGSIGEYDFSLGANVENKLYLGFTFGVQSVSQRLDLLYGEEYKGGTGLQYERLKHSQFNQAIITEGVGVNLKLGATYRPTDGLRLGIAYHSPTWYSLNRKYQISMAAAAMNVNSGEDIYMLVDSPLLEDSAENQWLFNSPSKLLLGGSYTFGQIGLLSVDYQRDWYSGMNMRSTPSGVAMNGYNNTFANALKSVNTLKVGGEIKPSPLFALRAGYGFSSSLLDSSNALWDMPVANQLSFYSAGIGYSPTNKVSLNFTYMYQQSESNSYYLFYGADVSGVNITADGFPSASSAQSRSFETTLKQHNIALSLVFRM